MTMSVQKISFLRIFIVIAIVLAGIVGYYFYLFEPNIELAERQKIYRELSAQVQMAMVKKYNERNILEKEKFEEEYNNSVKLDSLVKLSGKVNGPEEQSRKEGVLWVDPENLNIIVTFGAVQGVHSGDYLTVYEADKKIGQVSVVLSLDVVSLVEPLDESVKLSANQYYRVLKEE